MTQGQWNMREYNRLFGKEEEPDKWTKSQFNNNHIMKAEHDKILANEIRRSGKVSDPKYVYTLNMKQTYIIRKRR